MQPKKLKELLDIVQEEIRAGISFPGDDRLLKLCIIDDIIRSYKVAQLYDKFAKNAISDLNTAFDNLYSTDIETLEAHLAALDKRNTAYMRKQLKAANLGVPSYIAGFDYSTINYN
jgi:hypothetical protein